MRGNPGGKHGNLLDIASHLVIQTTQLGKDAIKRDSMHYEGKLYVLTDCYTSSGAEALAALLKVRPNTLVIGQRTGGDCGSRNYNFKTSHGIEFKLSTRPPYLLPDGETWSEGEGVVPDIEVEERLPWEKEAWLSWLK